MIRIGPGSGLISVPRKVGGGIASGSAARADAGATASSDNRTAIRKGRIKFMARS